MKLPAHAILGLALVAFPPAPDQATIRSGVQTVAIYSTVSDGTGRLALDLTRDDFQISDNGRPVDIDVFSSAAQPITVAVMLDMSGSMEQRFLRVRDSTSHFVDALLPVDRATIGTFGTEVFVSPLLTAEKGLLKRVLQQELWPGGETPLWQALDLAMTALAGQPGRRVVLALTDGGDTGSLPGSKVTLPRVEARARDDAFMVYAIGIEGTGLDRGIVRLADETGGGHFELDAGADLTATFVRVADELRHQYLVGFTPRQSDGKLHQLDVRVSRKGYSVRARKTYRAPGR
jgi:Ca-activated chloride channel homolog